MRRRTFLSTTAVTTLGLAAVERAVSAQTGGSGQTAGVSVHWLDGTPPPAETGITWGVPWPRGAVRKDQGFTLTGSDGKALALQTWPLAYWPDGSLKWSGLATVAAAGAAGRRGALSSSLLVALWRVRVGDGQGVGAVGGERGVVALRDGSGVGRRHRAARYPSQLVEAALHEVDRQRGVAEDVHLGLASAEQEGAELAERVPLVGRHVVGQVGRNDHVGVRRELIGARVRVVVDLGQVLRQVRGGILVEVELGREQGYRDVAGGRLGVVAGRVEH